MARGGPAQPGRRFETLDGPAEPAFASNGDPRRGDWSGTASGGRRPSRPPSILAQAGGRF